MYPFAKDNDVWKIIHSPRKKEELHFHRKLESFLIYRLNHVRLHSVTGWCIYTMMLNVEYSKPDKLAQPFFFLSLVRLNYLSEKFVKNFAILFCSFTLCLFIVVVFLFTIHSFINPSIHPFIHSVSQSASQSFVYSLIRSFSRSFTCVKLLFCFPDKVSKKHSVF